MKRLMVLFVSALALMKWTVDSALPEDCNKGYEKGECNDTETWTASRLMNYWDPITKFCNQTFNYSGCGGNMNKFFSPSECRTACDPFCKEVHDPPERNITDENGVVVETSTYCQAGYWYDWNILKCRHTGCA